MAEYIKVRKLSSEGLSMQAISRQTGFHRETVKKILALQAPPFALLISGCGRRLMTGKQQAPQLLLQHHLKALRLPTFLREYEKVAMQCASPRGLLGRLLTRIMLTHFSAM